MKAVLIALFVGFSGLAYGQVVIRPLKDSPVKAGDIVAVEIEAQDEALVRTLPVKSLLGIAVPDILWFMSAEDWKTSSLTTTAQVVLGAKFNPTQPLSIVTNGQQIELNFVDWKFTSQEQQPAQEFEYQDLPWYRRPWWIKYGFILSLVLMVVLIVGGRWGYRRHLQKKSQRQLALERGLVLDRFESAKEISTLSALWLERDQLKILFPLKEAALRSFFDVLNQHQFRPTSTDSELQEVLKAKRRLLDQLRGSDGV